jgi:signal transduction histidine kinase
MEKLKNTQAQLIQAEKLAAIGRLAANVAHEINNPLTGVLMASSLLLEEVEQHPYKSELETIKRETLRARGIVKNLLDFARQSEGNLEEINLNQIVQSSVALLRRQIDLRGVELLDDYAPQVLEVSVDRNQIMQVFYNLITNALDAMPHGGSLTIRTKAEDDSATVEFTDTGVGIPAEYIDKIFEPFFTTKPEAKGTGLGLSISYNIVNQFGGKIEVDSQPGKGSTFKVRLPLSTKRR